MRCLPLLLLLLFTLSLNAQEAGIKKSIATFFEGMHTGDTIKMKSVCDKGLKLQSITETVSAVKVATDEAASFYKSIASLPDNVIIEERILSYTIQIDGVMAHAWIPYEFYINGKLSHSGVNSFQLYNENGVWKILYIADTRRK